MPVKSVSQQGFSLPEVLLAIFILSVGMAAVATMLTDAMKTDKYSAETRSGDSKAMDTFETVKGLAVDAEVSAQVGSDGPFQYAYTVTTNTPCKGIHQVDMTIGWGGADCRNTDLSKCTHTRTVTNFIIDAVP
jgi:prepilin-type N-terminal cleavage/methylation domain-containing protein